MLKKHSDKIIAGILIVVVTAIFNYGGKSLSMPYDNKRNIQSNTEDIQRVEANTESKLTIGEFERMFEEHSRADNLKTEFIVRELTEMKILISRNHPPLTSAEQARIDKVIKDNGFHIK